MFVHPHKTETRCFCERDIVKQWQQRDFPLGSGLQQHGLPAAACQAFTGIIYLPAHLIVSSPAQWVCVALWTTGGVEP